MAACQILAGGYFGISLDLRRVLLLLAHICRDMAEKIFGSRVLAQIATVAR